MKVIYNFSLLLVCSLLLSCKIYRSKNINEDANLFFKLIQEAKYENALNMINDDNIDNIAFIKENIMDLHECFISDGLPYFSELEGNSDEHVQILSCYYKCNNKIKCAQLYFVKLSLNYKLVDVSIIPSIEIIEKGTKTVDPKKLKLPTKSSK